jgi:hypothetical protein
MKALLRWSVFCLATGRRFRPHLDPEPFYAIADDPDLDYEGRLAEYRALADAYFESDRYVEFCAARLGDVDEMVLEWVSSPDFDALLVDTVRSGFPEHEQEQFLGHFRGLIGMWRSDEERRLARSPDVPGDAAGEASTAEFVPAPADTGPDGKGG